MHGEGTLRHKDGGETTSRFTENRANCEKDGVSVRRSYSLVQYFEHIPSLHGYRYYPTVLDMRVDFVMVCFMVRES